MNAQPACFYRQYEGSLDSENVQLYWLKAEKSSIRYHLVFMKQPHQVYCQQLFGSQYFYPKKKSSPYRSIEVANVRQEMANRDTLKSYEDTIILGARSAGILNLRGRFLTDSTFEGFQYKGEVRLTPFVFKLMKTFPTVIHQERDTLMSLNGHKYKLKCLFNGLDFGESWFKRHHYAQQQIQINQYLTFYKQWLPSAIPKSELTIEVIQGILSESKTIRSFYCLESYNTGRSAGSEMQVRNYDIRQRKILDFEAVFNKKSDLILLQAMNERRKKNQRLPLVEWDKNNFYITQTGIVFVVPKTSKDVYAHYYQEHAFHFDEIKGMLNPTFLMGLGAE